MEPSVNGNGIRRKHIYTPYDVSVICRVDEMTVGKWMDSGELHSFEIPGQHRRILSRKLEHFIQQKQMERCSHWHQTAQKFRILVVEDDSDMLEIIGELLSEIEEADVQMEDSGFGAALKIASWHPDLILLDFVMPGMDGFEISRHLKKDPKTKDIPILAITSLSSAENRKAVLECGISAFLGKPFRADRMLGVVRELLGLPALQAE